MTSRLGTDGKIFNLFLQCTPPLLSLSMHCILILSFQGLKPSYISASISCTFHYLLFFTISAFHYLPLSTTVSSILHFCLPSLSSAFHILPLSCTSILYYPLPSNILCFSLSLPSIILRLPLPSTVLYLHLLLSSPFHTICLYYPPPSTILCLSLHEYLSFIILRCQLSSAFHYPPSTINLGLPLSSAFPSSWSGALAASSNM